MKLFTFVADSDYQVSSGKIRGDKKGHVDDIIKRGKAEFFISCGDLTQGAQTGKTCCCIGSDELGVFEREVKEPLEKAGIKVWACLGNHDVNPIILPCRWFKKIVGDNIWRKLDFLKIRRNGVVDWIEKEYGARYYQFIYKGIRFVSLDLYPKEKIRNWFLENVPTDLPIIVFWHYNVEGSYSVEPPNNWWDKKDRSEIFDILNNKYQTLAVLVGHHHSTYQYHFEGIPIIVSGGNSYMEMSVYYDEDSKYHHISTKFKRPSSS